GPMIPDPGKLMQLFLVREVRRGVLGPLHPSGKGSRLFEGAVPPLPEGRYRIFCDLALEGGMSATAMTTVELPAISAAGEAAGAAEPKADVDDSWASFNENAVPGADSPAPVFRLPDGTTVMWKA